jgi:hypothetical protein
MTEIQMFQTVHVIEAVVMTLFLAFGHLIFPPEADFGFRYSDFEFCNVSHVNQALRASFKAGPTGPGSLLYVCR